MQPDLIKFLSQEIIKHWDHSGNPLTLASKMIEILSNLQTNHPNQIKPNNLMHAFVYIMRLRKKFPSVKSQSGCSYRLFIVSLILSSDALDIEDWANAIDYLFDATQLKRMVDEFKRFLVDLRVDRMEICYWLDVAQHNMQVVPSEYNNDRIAWNDFCVPQ